jgi:hypothetical protein
VTSGKPEESNKQQATSGKPESRSGKRGLSPARRFCF